jgi:flagellar hook-length control protein FliK
VDNIVDSSGMQQPAAPARTDYDVPQQIIDQAKLIKTTEDTQMVIKLKPEHLGELTLKVSVTENGAVNASFHSDNAQVRGIIESSMVQLKQELQAQGLKVDNVGVYAGLGDSSLLDQGMQQGNNAYAQGKSVKSHDADLDSFEDEAEAFSTAASSIDGVSAADGVDYRV